MSNEERLEEIKKLSYLSSVNDYNKKVLLDKHGSWLIGQIECKQLLEEENKKLREALEQISNSDVWFENEGLDNYDAWLRCSVISDKALEQSK